MLKDSEWSAIDGKVCRVISFDPTASIQNGKIVALDTVAPYASVTLECKKMPGVLTGFITHEMDFEHLWEAFGRKGVGRDEEVLISWSKRRLKNYAKVLAAFMPRLWVMVCPKGAFEIMTDSSWKPELTGEARFNAEKPIAQWKPEVME